MAIISLYLFPVSVHPKGSMKLTGKVESAVIMIGGLQALPDDLEEERIMITWIKRVYAGIVGVFKAVIWK